VNGISDGIPPLFRDPNLDGAENGAENSGRPRFIVPISRFVGSSSNKRCDVDTADSGYKEIWHTQVARTMQC
jgi:hypothetical protein